MKKTLFTLGLALLCLQLSAQQRTKRVLFLGNSYIYTNNMPQMLKDMAASAGDTVLFDSNTPGGHTFQQHSFNSTSLAKLAAGNWDYVVLQEQSQLPAFPEAQVQLDVYPYAKLLDSLAHQSSPCAETVFYMTWGRKNGDAANCGFYAPLCTYQGMDSLLNLRYRTMAADNEALLSPVGAVWRYLRTNSPGIELYQADESHPSLAGSYAAACCFYTVFFRKDPALLSYTASLPAADAATIRNAVRTVVYQDLPEWHVGGYDPQAGFSLQEDTLGHILLTNTSQNADSYRWDFGDWGQSQDENPEHTYFVPGTYTVRLIASRCGRSDTFSVSVTIETVGLASFAGEEPLRIYPNPAAEQLFIGTGTQTLLAEVRDMQGKVCIPKRSVQGQLSLEALPAGTYCLILSAEGKEGVQRSLFVKR